MSFQNILFHRGKAIAPDEICDIITAFGYHDAVRQIFQDSKVLDSGGDVFIKCAAHILVNFKMTRAGPFKGLRIDEHGHVTGQEKLVDCWKVVGKQLIEINKVILKSGYPRDRYLLELDEHERQELIAIIWAVTKQLLPFTMGGTTYGLVGASKILFAVLPEIVLPVDNTQWLTLFRTVDLGDVISGMVLDIQHWETVSGKRLNEVDSLKRVPTLPAVYNVMAMAAR